MVGADVPQCSGVVEHHPQGEQHCAGLGQIPFPIAPLPQVPVVVGAEVGLGAQKIVPVPHQPHGEQHSEVSAQMPFPTAPFPQVPTPVGEVADAVGDLVGILVVEAFVGTLVVEAFVGTLVVEAFVGILVVETFVGILVVGAFVGALEIGTIVGALEIGTIVGALVGAIVGIGNGDIVGFPVQYADPVPQYPHGEQQRSGSGHTPFPTEPLPQVPPEVGIDEVGYGDCIGYGADVTG